MQTSQTRRGEVDAGVPISDVIRDRRRDKPTDDELALIVRNLWQSGLDSTRDLRRQWVRNRLMTYTDLDIQWSRRAERYLNTPAKKTRQYRTPLLPGRVAYFAARMTQSAPEWTCIPADDGLESEEAAKFSEKVLRYAYRKQRIDLARYFATIQMCLYGFGLLETYVDEEASLVLEFEPEVDASGQPVYDDEGNPVWQFDKKGRPRIKEAFTKPGIKSRPVSPFSFIMPPGMEWPMLPEAPYVVRAKWLTESYVRRRFEVTDDVTLVSDSFGDYEALTSHLSQVANPGAPDRGQRGQLLVLEYYEPARDCEGFYEGKVLTVCGNKVIGNERSLFDDGRYPFFMFPWMPVTDSPYAFPWLNPQIDPQSRVNQTTTDLMNNVAMVGRPNIIADRASGFPPKPSFNYSVYHLTPGSRRPEFMQAPMMPTGAFEMMATAKRDMDDAGMSYPLARGESQKGITSGLHARTIQDADQTEMGPVVRMHAAEFSRMGEAILELYRDHGGDDQMLSIVGDSGKCEMFAFKKLRIPIGQQVIVQEESLLVHYRSALEERAVALGTAGAFGNMQSEPAARGKFLSAIRDVKLAGPLTPEEAQKQMLDELHYSILIEGKQPKIEPWWNLNAHREAAHDRLVRERRRWNQEQYNAFMTYWANLEDEASRLAEQEQKSAVDEARLQIELQGEMLRKEGEEKAKIELLRQTGKLATESMKSGEMGAGAGAGAAALSATAPEEELESEEEEK